MRERSAGTAIIPRTVPGGLGETRGIPRGETEEEEIARSGLIVLLAADSSSSSPKVVVCSLS